jgi:hypothetical protein
MLINPPILKPIKIDNKIDNNNNNQLINGNNTSITADNIQTIDKPAITKVMKKKQYRQFYKMVKQGKFTTALLSARILNVDRHTIAKWLETPKIKEAMERELQFNVDQIRANKDWKANAYLIDKISPDKENQTNNQNIITNIQFILDDKD